MDKLKTVTNSDHRHLHNKPYFIPIVPDETITRPSVDDYGRLHGDGGSYSHKMDGKGIYGFMCECGQSRKSVKFATKEEARELARIYKARVSVTSHQRGGLESDEKGQGGSVLQQQEIHDKET